MEEIDIGNSAVHKLHMHNAAEASALPASNSHKRSLQKPGSHGDAKDAAVADDTRRAVSPRGPGETVPAKDENRSSSINGIRLCFFSVNDCWLMLLIV